MSSSLDDMAARVQELEFALLEAEAARKQAENILIYTYICMYI